MAKTVTLPAVRVEPEHRDALERIGEGMQPQVSLSSLVRQSVLEYIERHEIRSTDFDGQADER